MSNIAIGSRPTDHVAVVVVFLALFLLPFLIITSISQLIYRGIVAVVLNSQSWFIANTDEPNKRLTSVAATECASASTTVICYSTLSPSPYSARR